MDNKNNSNNAGCLSFVLIVMLLACIITLFSKDDDKEGVSDSQVYATAETEIKTLLKSPSTADFPYDGHVQKIGHNRFRVFSYVDAQNSFGAILRSNWVCELTYKGGDWSDLDNWAVTYMNLLNQ